MKKVIKKTIGIEACYAVTNKIKTEPKYYRL